MVRIIKLENIAEDKFDEALFNMQNSFGTFIINIQCYGVNNDCYLITYERDNELSKKELIDSITSVSLDE